MLLAIKKKLHAYVVRKGYSLNELVAIMDRNGDKEISLAEFMKETKTFLEESEAVELFKAIDNDNTGTLTADEITIELASIRASLILNKIKESAASSNLSPQELFETYDNDRSGKMEVNEFGQFLDQAAQ
mmetsp:Transcript_27861/g.37221  ORF Transcript_27861/g.37221 Transcript_27861/m.37221 type:complete len:130 (+) Transcript_27861:1382-1771(+)|eukprot:CAMPEP_0185605470 /NCGR_PEP_ID=MMETSP0436-20130131/4063_1 /TAXON_ID=626734 ORGANISM="Favella taraikaensis, Strain Fe Narragansett Bay" /NCGR_SAMPLE_ID=MMETSP0436 /ASSEMBLY_ACC=CAM_ASM_000390 /LENGTH=129 /DNA_ID=CAMNT_0028236685 /DNA_START=753 /DNA_END=1142 /DNA_ORIENTATION=+